MKYTENIGLPIVEDNDLYSKEINNLAFEEIDKNIEALAERIDLIDDPETGLGNLLEIMVRKEDIAQDLDAPERETVLSTEALAEILDKKTEEIEALIENTDNATRLDLTNKVLLNKVVNVALNASNELIVTYGDGTELNVGVVGTGGTVTPSSENKIEVDTDTDEEYILKITTDGTDFLTPNLKGAGDNIFVGIDVDGEAGDIVVDVADARLGDVYINSDNGNIYVREDLNGLDNNWTFKGNIKGKQGKSNYDLAIDNGFIGTEQDYLDSLVAENIEALIVDAKPVLADPTTELKTWYFYQVDGDTIGSAWKYKMVLPNTADYPAGDYCVYYDLKPYCGTFTVGSPALTNKDRYKYYAIMDLQAVTTELIREDLDTGNTVVLEKIQCTQEEPTTHIVINEHIETLGKWVQTLYIGATKDTASEVTINTGTKTTGFINNAQLINYVGDRALLTTDAQDTLVSAINELNGILRTSNTTTLNTYSTTIIDAINELNTKSDINIYILRSDNILDFAVSQEAYKYKIVYANNCDGLPNGEKYGFCYVGTSHDPLYKTVIFNSITTAKRWSTYRYPDPSNPFADGTWSAWREDVTSDAIVTALNELNTDAQIPSAKAMYNYTKDRTAKTYTNILQLGLTAPIETKDIYNAMPNGSVAYIEVNSSTITDAPCNTGILIINKVNIGSFNIVCKKSSAGNIEPNDIYLGNLKGNDGAGLTWTEVGSGGANTGGGAITNLTELGLTTPTNIQDVFNAVPSGNILILGCTEDEVMGIPTYSGILTIDKYSASRFNIMFKKSFSGSVATNDLYLGSLKGVDGSGIVWNRTMIDTDVVIALDDTVTDNQVPSAKAVYDLVKNDVGSQLEIQGIKDDITELQDKAIEDITYANGELTFTKGDTTQKTIGIASKITELQDVNISNPVASEVIAYSASAGKWINSSVSTTDQYVKMSATDANGRYLSDLIDNDTIHNNGGKLEVTSVKGLQATTDELNTLIGMNKNIKDLFDSIGSGGMKFKDVVPTYSALPSVASNGDVYVVLADETDNGNRNAYIYSDTKGDYIPLGGSGMEIRDFVTNPINLTREVTGVLPKANMDCSTFVDKTSDIASSITYPIPASDLDKIPNLNLLKQTNQEISTALSKKVNTTDVVTALTPSSTDTQIPSAKVVVDELNTKANDSEVVKKTDIATTIDNTVTNEQVAGAKAVYNTTSKFLKTYTSIEQLGLTSESETIENIANSMESRTRLITVIEGGNLSIYPNTSGTLIVEKMNIYRVHLKFCMDGLPTVYVGTYHAVSGFTGWHRICTTTVADVPAKRVAVNNWATGDVVYTVKNGICYVWISALASSTMDTSNQIIVNNLPVPKSPGLWCSIGSNDCTKGTLLVLVGTSGELKNYSGLNNAQYFGSFSYPVAE